MNQKDSDLKIQPVEKVAIVTSEPVVSSQPFIKKLYLNKKLMLIFSVVSILVLSGSVVAFKLKTSNSNKISATDTSLDKDEINETQTASPEETVHIEPNKTPDSKSKTTSTTETTATTPEQTPATTVPVPAFVNTTNCLPENPSKYATYYIGMTNTSYLQTNSYSETSKMYAALEFAGLLTAVDSKQVVVFTPNDYVFTNKLTATQWAWMNQSPENMRSVLGWQIATSCITWNGVNPVKDKTTGTKTVINTLNGPVTYTHGSPGKIENAQIAIWDWFTSNGSVTFMSDFIKPPLVP